MKLTRSLNRKRCGGRIWGKKLSWKLSNLGLRSPKVERTLLFQYYYCDITFHERVHCKQRLYLRFLLFALFFLLKWPWIYFSAEIEATLNKLKTLERNLTAKEKELRTVCRRLLFSYSPGLFQWLSHFSADSCSSHLYNNCTVRSMIIKYVANAGRGPGTDH